MSSTEYIAVAAGLIAVWQGVEQATAWLSLREQNLLWAFSIPL